MIILRVKLSGSVILLMLFVNIVKAQHITLLQQGKPTSIRGLSVVDNNIAWISGSKGCIALTKDGGKTWTWQQVKAYEKSDFRAIQAFSAKEAIIMSSGTPALVLKTIDGGNTWAEKYKNTDTSYFLDAMDFADAEHGYILGDPINNKFVLLETKDAGETWNMFKTRPNALTGEAAFAASNTCLRVYTSTIEIITGGSHSRLLVFPRNKTAENYWGDSPTGLAEGKSSQGAFSFSEGGSTQIFVGGDYTNDKQTDSVASYIVHCCYVNAIHYPKTPPMGYQSCVEYIKDSAFLSTGTPGTNITVNGGQTWSKIDSTSFNVCRKAKRGTLILLAGNNGKIALFEP
jgi:Photosynthesis system II assembly factor YCF48